MLGVSIPTMCYIEGLEPFTSCMICQVKNEANGRLIAGCSAPAEDGMKIVTVNDEVRKAGSSPEPFSDHAATRGSVPRLQSHQHPS